MRKVTINDIAKMAGVSKTTVSMVFNNKDENISRETREKILNIAKELNYIPNSIARSLATKKSYSIGIILPDITNPFFSEIARAIEDEANKLGYNVVLCNTDNKVKKEEEYVKLLISKLIDGIIFIAGGESKRSIDLIKNNNIPFVLVDRYIDGYEECYGVFCKNYDGVVEGVEYLLSKNKRNIVFVNGPKDLEISRQRFQGYKDTMMKYGLFKEKLVYESDFTLEGGKIVTQRIINELKDFDAIFYSNDVMAFGGIKVLLRNGFKIPEKISIMGFDNIQISQFIEPELTTIAQPIYDMGKRACSLLIDIINGEENIEKVYYFMPKLIIRSTT
ncbi:LacI family DNA-binding transcriptional regulator [Thermobrachium celere]|uniref:Ribose operon repressor n=1 Tax=Thermobrachium celere DSM 8682 TaxID=941824 RepID=R7RS83_9CLOT|nr:LacI family DNA-binding transcriptional regulator [Thermobrachium celere]CDF59022.1 Ribose operon repressor [Thermobrachium celere DSM 8682]